MRITIEREPRPSKPEPTGPSRVTVARQQVVGAVKAHRLITAAIVAVVAAAVVLPIALHKPDHHPTYAVDGQDAVNAAREAQTQCGWDVIDWTQPVNFGDTSSEEFFYYTRKDGNGEVLSTVTKAEFTITGYALTDYVDCNYV